MRTLVLGAGVVGVAAAYYLARAGHQVTVVERQAGPGLETSFANGGQIAANHSEPWANPGTPAKVLKWLGRADAPILFRLRADPRLWRWVLGFLGNCTARRARINTERMTRVALYSRAALAELRAATNIQYDQRTRGILHIYRDPREYEHALAQAEMVRPLGCVRQALDAAGCVGVEPALARVRDTLVGGLYCPDDESGDAYTFTARLADICAGEGVEFRYGTTVERLRAEGDRVTGADTDSGTLTADATVLALGSYSPFLTGPLGITLPVYPAKGYSVTIPVERPEGAPEVGLLDDERKLVYSRLGQRLRVAGTAEFAGYDTAVTESRARFILDSALELFPDCGDAAKAEFWAGLRPMTPDNVPVIGRTRYANLILDTGHGTLGWTMACGSGRIVADLVSGRTPEIDLDGLGVERFG